jgi:hypothetical protein
VKVPQKLSERERSQMRRAAKAAAEGRALRAYLPGRPSSSPEQKRLSRLRALPGYVAPKHDAHVHAWCAKAETEAKALARLQRLWTSKADAHVTLWKRECGAAWFRHQYRTNPEFNARQKMKARLRKKARLDGAIASGVAAQLKQGRFGKGWQELLGYTAAELIAHLRRTVPKGRTWDDFMAGLLHIDHITPCAAFDLTRPDEVRACWALGNLRLIDAAENLRKSARREFLL